MEQSELKRREFLARLSTVMLELITWRHPKFYFLWPKFAFYLMPCWHHFFTRVFGENLHMMPICHFLASNPLFLWKIYGKKQTWRQFSWNLFKEITFYGKNMFKTNKTTRHQNVSVATKRECCHKMSFRHDAFLQVRHQIAF